MYLTNATDYFFTFFDAMGSQNHTTEACWQGGFWGVSVKGTNHKLESHLGLANHSTAVMTHIASTEGETNCSQCASLNGYKCKIYSVYRKFGHLRHTECKDCVIWLIKSSDAWDFWIVMHKQLLKGIPNTCLIQLCYYFTLMLAMIFNTVYITISLMS